MRWPWSTRPAAPRNTQVPLLAWARATGQELTDLVVDETSALGLSALHRAVSLISGTLASAPLNTWRTGEGGARVATPSVFDDPDPDGQTPFEWKESLLIHLLLHGRGYALKLTNEAGSVARLPLAHPLTVTEEKPTPEQVRRGEVPVGGKWFRLTLDNGRTVRYDARDMWHVPGPPGGGLIERARRSLSTTLAGDRASEKMFTDGAMIAGLVTPDTDEDLTDDRDEIRRQINDEIHGVANAGKIAVIARQLKFTPWTMTAADAQFLQQRQFQIEEIARWTGVPPHALMQTEKQTSWGTGVESQDRGLARTVLNTWATRIEQRGGRLLQRPRWLEFDFSTLERPSPEVEREMIRADWESGLITRDEARGRMNLIPLGGDLGAALKDTAPAPAPAGGGDDDPPTE